MGPRPQMHPVIGRRTDAPACEVTHTACQCRLCGSHNPRPPALDAGSHRTQPRPPPPRPLWQSLLADKVTTQRIPAAMKPVSAIWRLRAPAPAVVSPWTPNTSCGSASPTRWWKELYFCTRLLGVSVSWEPVPGAWTAPHEHHFQPVSLFVSMSTSRHRPQPPSWPWPASWGQGTRYSGAHDQHVALCPCSAAALPHATPGPARLQRTSLSGTRGFPGRWRRGKGFRPSPHFPGPCSPVCSQAAAGRPHAAGPGVRSSVGTHPPGRWTFAVRHTVVRGPRRESGFSVRNITECTFAVWHPESQNHAQFNGNPEFPHPHQPSPWPQTHRKFSDSKLSYWGWKSTSMRKWTNTQMKTCVLSDSVLLVLWCPRTCELCWDLIHDTRPPKSFVEVHTPWEREVPRKQTAWTQRTVGFWITTEIDFKDLERRIWEFMFNVSKP